MSEKNLKLYIHIGQAKTGSTAIQSFLNHNQKSLIENYNILYPNMMGGSLDQGSKLNHGRFFEDTFKSQNDKLLLQTIFACKDYCFANNIMNVILSCEALYNPINAPEINRIVKLFNCDFN